MKFDYPGRVKRLQGSMIARDVDAVLLSVGADLPYFTGYEAMPTERLTALVVTASGTPTLLVPELEAPRVEAGEFQMRAWGESEDPISLASTILGQPKTVAVGDQMWSTFLLKLQKEWPHASWLAASELTQHLRMRKEPAEIDALRRAAHGVDRVLERIPKEVPFAGRTEAEVARRLAAMTVEEGHLVADFAIVASGPNGASPHHDPGDRVIEEGDLVVCDFGGRWDEYHSDCTRTFSVGEPSDEHAEVHQTVLAANQAARNAVGPGVPCQEIDRAAREVIVDAGYGDYFIHRTGHGIGLDVHEHPYMVEGNEMPLEPGMTFSVEPGIYLPDRFGVRIEDIVACADDGSDSLNTFNRSLVIVG